jgi:hypothetical protein
MATFKSTATRNLGTSPTTIHTAPSGTVVIGLSAANIYGSELPIDVWHRRSSNDTKILQQFRVGPGETEELMRGNKIVLQAGDLLMASTAVANGFDILVSVLESV